MKIIISHDIDHLSVKEHIFKDLIIPKYIIWSSLELIKKKISLKTFFVKMIALFEKGAWNNLEELLKFDQKNGINSTFFVAVNNGKGLSYSFKQAQEAIDLIKKYDFDVGVHGVCYDNYRGIKEEYELFKKISGLENFGIRMHYLRLTNDTLQNLSKTGYVFDSTILSDNLGQKYKINRINEIPFHIMDGNMLGSKSVLCLEDIKKKTQQLLERAEREGQNYVAILFHQRYFGEDFPQCKKWYLWLICYCKKQGYEFDNYRELL